MQPSRRAFLFGRAHAPATPWAQFCRRLTRTCQGRVVDTGGAAQLTPSGVADVLHARALCAQYGVRLALTGVDGAPPEAPLLWLDPTALTRLEPLVQAPGLWRAEAGVQIGALRALGLRQFAKAPEDMTLAVWLACQAGALCATGCTADAGVLGADVMLADGTRSALGPFGERDLQPLRSAVMRQLVSKLFELTGSDDAQACLAQAHWPARLRLDALRPQEGGVNLAQLLLGHAGGLAWVEAVVLAAPQGSGVARVGLRLRLTQATTTAAARLDAAVQSLFDPGDLFAVSFLNRRNAR